jgi:hypothetical protein
MRKRAMNVYMKNEEQTNSACDAEIHTYKRPVKGLEHLHGPSHGWRCGLGFFSRSSSELLLEVVDEEWRDDRDGLVVVWPKTSRRGNKEQW